MEKKATRLGYGEALAELGKENNKIVVLSADVTASTMSNLFANAFPDRFFNVGVAEQNMIGISAGLSLMGLIPYACAYSIFTTGRPWDQIRNTVCYSNLNVKIVGTHSGIMVGPDGATHQALEDIAIMRAIPNMKIIVPCDYYESIKATKKISEISGPVFLRLGRTAVPVMTNKDTEFEIGKMNIMREGSDVSIFACGVMVSEALRAAEILEHENIKAKVVNVHTIKPLDTQTLINTARETGAVVTAEEHQIIGGLGSAISEELARSFPAPMEMIGIKDVFGESGEPDELLKVYGLTAEKIVASAKKAMSRKKQCNG
ncbi:MAG: transketolase family protein [Elusimicrobiota bacterium]